MHGFGRITDLECLKISGIAGKIWNFPKNVYFRLIFLIQAYISIIIEGLSSILSIFMNFRCFLHFFVVQIFLSDLK